MDWTSLYLKTANLNVFILGTGEVATRRANKFLDHGANVKLAGDILEIELQDYSRKLLKSRMSDQKKRRQYLYEIFNDENIKGLLDNHKIDEAKEYIDDLIRGFDDT